MAEKMKNDNPRGSNELRGTLSRAVRLLEFLKDNTDENNKISQTKLLKEGGEEHIFGAKATLKKTIVALADALNTDERGALKPKEDWRLSYKGFEEYYSDCGSDNDDEKPTDVTGIYYNHVFSDDDITAIINALCTSKAVHKEQAEDIIGKLVKNFAKKDYEQPRYKLDFSERTDILPGKNPELLSQNITIIQKAIGEGFRISFDYNRIYSNPKGKLGTYKERVLYVSPHYIVCENGRLFIYGGFDNKELCVFRVDMMTNICLAGKGKSMRPSLEKFKIGLPENMTEQFKIRHLYSSYMRDEITEAKFEWSCRDEKTSEFICTALYGTFGNFFEIDGKGEVTVYHASRFGLKIFALQYADYVKVTSPESLVNDIAKSVRGLRDKYL